MSVVSTIPWLEYQQNDDVQARPILIQASTETDLQASEIADVLPGDSSSPSSTLTRPSYVRESTRPEVMHWADDTTLYIRTYRSRLVTLNDARHPGPIDSWAATSAKPERTPIPYASDLRAMIGRQKKRRDELLVTETQ